MYLPTFLVSSLAVKNTADRLELTGRPMIFSDLRHKVADLRHVWGQVPLQPAPRRLHPPIAFASEEQEGSIDPHDVARRTHLQGKLQQQRSALYHSSHFIHYF
ncbi:hypothetical protein SNOG_10818 [Parastagonospora nodorum SN15]|uniref:Uncharacterized protein n=1 Tax=Phaeosphaeria nodorum (strain SN15 / ATCC MYA-4574 / FGSC 10173) TaxID=321614 RepID=Q0UBP6_PHANO|nr:hypothetical protein SNOG_10818 [Parastagonospora nodorum SN15]EAT82212.1 hypothetical protein SNOG_10818 [Parastagonospora nodorum SN15]